MRSSSEEHRKLWRPGRRRCRSSRQQALRSCGRSRSMPLGCSPRCRRRQESRAHFNCSLCNKYNAKSSYARMLVVQVSKLLLSLPSPAAPPIAQLPPPPALAVRLVGSRDGSWMAGSAVDVSLRLPAEAASPSHEDTAARDNVMPRSGGASAVSTAAEALAYTAPAGQAPLPRGRVSQQVQQQRSLDRFIPPVPPDERDGTWHMSGEYAAADSTQGATAEQVSQWRRSDSTGGAKQTSRARRDAQTASMQRPAPPVLAALPPSSGRRPGSQPVFRQPNTAAHGVMTGPPSPTFSAMERAASAAANVAARLFDTDVRAVEPANSLLAATACKPSEHTSNTLTRCASCLTVTHAHLPTLTRCASCLTVTHVHLPTLCCHVAGYQDYLLRQHIEGQIQITAQAPFGKRHVGLPAPAPMPSAARQKTAAPRPSARRTPSTVPMERGTQHGTHEPTVAQLAPHAACQSCLAVTPRCNSSGDDDIGCSTTDSQTMQQTLEAATGIGNDSRGVYKAAATGARTFADGNTPSRAEMHRAALLNREAVASDAISDPSSSASDSSTSSDSGAFAAGWHPGQEPAVRPANTATPSTVGAHERPRPLPDFLSRGGTVPGTASAQLSSTAPGGMSCGDARFACRDVLINRC